ncbi:D-xylose 1-dehydrogenase (NADP(+)) 2 [Hypsizygus marmoreus]|uniref:D-xylose 1-dehydrogenase (NADP(+), D-xylono-1,5-lactone-forming) n=1 Tax=Hypsizygus marmoreus TaxID=39966 RepID=A0A369JQB0_HYPMA|nr:D-xylose 1-dehydrogenase (NADP(+)) 2 [Hypsizygus marmoreus]
MSTIIGFFRRLYETVSSHIQPQPQGRSRVLKFGIVGAKPISPPVLIFPAKSHPEVLIHGVAARDESRDIASGKKHGIEKTYAGPNGGYQALLDDPEIEAIYIALRNGLQYEWTMKALAAGKHVLLGKPLANTADETRRMFDLAEHKGLILLEAFHYRFHPSIQRVKAIIESGELGAVKSISVNLMFPELTKESGDRYDYDLGDGAWMNIGCYAISCIRYLSSSDPMEVISATHEMDKPASAPADFVPSIDRKTTATLSLPNDVIATVTCDLGIPHYLGFIPHLPQLGITVECTGGEIELNNYVLPTIYHAIKVYTRDATGMKKYRVEKAYTFADGDMDEKGDEWWTMHRYQLEAFVDRIMVRKTLTWVDGKDSVINMEWVEKIYTMMGLGSRPWSKYVPEREGGGGMAL